MQYNPGRLFYRWSIISGAEFSDNAYSGSYVAHIYTFYDVTYDIALRYKAVRIPLLLQYTFPTKRIQPYISAGINNVLLISPTYSILETDLSPSTNTTSTVHIQSGISQYQRRLSVNAGVFKNLTKKTRLTLGVGYEYRVSAQNFSSFLELQSIQSYAITAGFLSKL